MGFVNEAGIHNSIYNLHRISRITVQWMCAILHLGSVNLPTIAISGSASYTHLMHWAFTTRVIISWHFLRSSLLYSAPMHGIYNNFRNLTSCFQLPNRCPTRIWMMMASIAKQHLIEVGPSHLIIWSFWYENVVFNTRTYHNCYTIACCPK